MYRTLVVIQDLVTLVHCILKHSQCISMQWLLPLEIGVPCAMHIAPNIGASIECSICGVLPGGVSLKWPLTYINVKMEIVGS